MNIQERLYVYNAKIVYAYDGDTVTASVDLGFHFAFNKQKLRLYGIDTPELRGDTLEAARAARDRLKELVLDKEVLIETFKDSKGKYGRYLAKVWFKLQPDDESYVCLNDRLVEEGHAVYREY